MGLPYDERKYKKCWICKRTKDRTEFYRDSARYDGIETRCKECEKTYRKEDKVKYDKKRYRTARENIINLLGRKCKRCGFDDYRALQIDHVKGGGNAERKDTKSTRTYYPHVLNKVRNGSSEYQILCANCNWIKKSENKEV